MELKVLNILTKYPLNNKFYHFLKTVLNEARFSTKELKKKKKLYFRPFEIFFF